MVKASQGLFDTPEKLEAIAELEAEKTTPELTRDLWATFLMLHDRRFYSMDGPTRFTWGEIQAYCAVSGARFTPWKLRVLFLIEDAYFAVRAENKGK